MDNEIDLRKVFDPETIPDEWLIERMRRYRDRALADSDWTQLGDAPVDHTAWANYRTALREFPETWTPSEMLILPTPPA